LGELKRDNLRGDNHRDTEFTEKILLRGERRDCHRNALVEKKLGWRKKIYQDD